MITIREYVESDAKALWDIHFNTIRNVNLRDYSQEQVEAWAPDCLDFSVW
ncbi:GNAT family N-acetyltransferase, partial [Photobacterium angustum]